MAIRDDIIVNWASSPRIIEVAAPSVTVSIQDLVDTCRHLEAEIENIDNERLIDASGKDDLGEGLLVGITLSLNNAKLKFEDRAPGSWAICKVSGGNLVAADDGGVSMNPIEPSSYVTVTLMQSVSATMVQDEEIDWIWGKTKNLPTDPTSKSDLEATHGYGSWEGGGGSRPKITVLKTKIKGMDPVIVATPSVSISVHPIWAKKINVWETPDVLIMYRKDFKRRINIPVNVGVSINKLIYWKVEDYGAPFDSKD